MNLGKLYEKQIATCDHCGLPVRVGDVYVDERSRDVVLGGDHSTCGDEHTCQTPVQYAQQLEDEERDRAFGALFKAHYCGGEP